MKTSDEGRIVIIWNPSAGSRDRSEQVHSRLTSMSNVVIVQPPSREETIETAASVESAALIVAAGGDGTVNAVLEGTMARSPRPALGIVPLGSGNDLARSLGIPLDPDDALDVLAAGCRREIDVVRLSAADGCRWYANMLTGGNTGRYLERMTDETKQRWGPLCYLRGVIDVVSDLQVFQVSVQCEDSPPETFEALNLFVANGRMSGGGLVVSPDAKLDDGLADLIVVRDGDPGDIAGLTASYLTAAYLDHDLVEFRRARRIAIEADPPMPLTADGEVIGTTPGVLEIEPRSLVVVAPPG